MDKFILALQLILSSTFFTFNGKIYKTNFWYPYVLILVSGIADVILQDLEEAFKKINLNIPFYFRYVNNVILAAPSN